MGKRGREVAERGREVGRKRRGWHHEAKERVLRKEWGNTVKVVWEQIKWKAVLYIQKKTVLLRHRGWEPD